MKRCIALVAFGVIAVAALPADAREGFGNPRRVVQLERRVPAEIDFEAKRIDIRVVDGGKFAAESRQLRELVEKTILANESRLSRNAVSPENVVELDVSSFRVDDSVKQKTGYETRQVVVPSVDIKGRQSTKLIHKSVPVTVEYIELSGTIESKFRVVDVATKREIFAASESADYFASNKLSDAAPTRMDVEKVLIARVASQIAAKLAGTSERVSVFLPRGGFERAIPLADRADWAAYEREIAAVPPMKRPTDEAFRHYALGVASEALAYRAGNEAEAIDRLRRAGDLYRKAVALHPGEELFAKEHSPSADHAAASPIERIDTALASYEKLRKFRAQLAAVPAAAPSNPPEAAKPSATVSATAKSPKPPMKNADVIEMAKAGFGDDFIIRAIDTAPSVKFDVTPQAVTAMTDAGVTTAVIAHIREKQK
jgi:hypothetical protein